MEVVHSMFPELIDISGSIDLDLAQHLLQLIDDELLVNEDWLTAAQILEDALEGFGEVYRAQLMFEVEHTQYSVEFMTLYGQYCFEYARSLYHLAVFEKALDVVVIAALVHPEREGEFLRACDAIGMYASLGMGRLTLVSVSDLVTASRDVSKRDHASIAERLQAAYCRGVLP